MNPNPSRRIAARTWLLAIRPATLPASMSGVVVGLGAAWGTGVPLRLDVALGCLAVALLLQICANLANDLSDFRRGADTPDRLGPTRVAAAGLATPHQLQIAIAIVIAIAGIVGAWLAIIGGPAFVALGLAAIAAATWDVAASARDRAKGETRWRICASCAWVWWVADRGPL